VLPTEVHNRRVQGINGYTNSLVRIGTIRWEIEDDEGLVHDLIIPESIYLPEATSRLLSPQHWAQSANDNRPNLNGTWCATYQDKIILYWKQGQYKRTVNLDAQGNNVATIWTAPGYSTYHAFEAKCGPEGDFITCDAMTISGDEGSAGEEEQEEERETTISTQDNPHCKHNSTWKDLKI
jgi:hypothetical protein